MMDDKELEKTKKILEKYQELGNPARNLLTEIIKKPSGIWRMKLKKFSQMNDKVLRDGINQLLDFKIIKRKETDGKVYYYLDKKYIWQISLIARKQSDKINLDSYRFDEIINENTTKSKTTIYGLKSEVFRAVVEGGHNTNIEKKETLNFVQGIKAKELFGLNFGTPLIIKIKKSIQTTEQEIIEKQREHYLDLMKKGMRIIRKKNIKEDRKTKKKGKIIKVNEEVIKDVIENIIQKHRNENINFKEAGENLVQKLLELKKNHRRREMEREYTISLSGKNGKVKRILKKFKEEFILILNHCDMDKIWIEETIFKFYGVGRGLYSISGALANEEKWKRNEQFAKSINKLDEQEKRKVIDFLIEVVEKNIDLYPTHVSLLCRTGSQDIMPLTKPKPHKSVQ